MLLSELDREGVSLYYDMTTDLIVWPSGSGCVDHSLGNLNMTSLSSGIKGPCPSHVDDALVEHFKSDVEDTIETIDGLLKETDNEDAVKGLYSGDFYYRASW